MMAFAWKWLVKFGLGKVFGGMGVVVLIGIVMVHLHNYEMAKANVITLQGEIAKLNTAMVEKDLAHFVEIEQAKANTVAAISALTRRTETKAETARVVTVVKTIVRPANEEKLCPPHPALVAAFDWLREKDGTADNNGTRASHANATR